MHINITVDETHGAGADNRTRTAQLEEHEVALLREHLRSAEAAQPDIFKARAFGKLADVMGAR